MILKKINWKSFFIFLAVSVLSTVISEFGIGCYYACGLGTDPISVFVDGLHAKFGLSYGDISTICNVILVGLMLIFERKHFGLGTFVGMLIGGPLIDLFEGFMSTNFPVETTSIVIRCLILLVALVTFGIGCGLGVASNLGVGSFQFIPLFIADKAKIDLKYAQMISDAMFFIVGWILGGIVGIGTIAGVLLTGPILEWTIKKVSKYFNKLGPIINK